MNANLIVDMDSPAFAEGPATELARILRQAALEIERDGATSIILRDRSGEAAGIFWLEDSGQRPPHLVEALSAARDYIQRVSERTYGDGANDYADYELLELVEMALDAWRGRRN